MLWMYEPRKAVHGGYPRASRGNARVPWQVTANFASLRRCQECHPCHADMGSRDLEEKGGWADFAPLSSECHDMPDIRDGGPSGTPGSGFGKYTHRFSRPAAATRLWRYSSARRLVAVAGGKSAAMGLPVRVHLPTPCDTRTKLPLCGTFARLSNFRGGSVRLRKVRNRRGEPRWRRHPSVTPA